MYQAIIYRTVQFVLKNDIIDNPLFLYFVSKATPRFELGIKDLQSSALPLGHVAEFFLIINIIIQCIIEIFNTYFIVFVTKKLFKLLNKLNKLNNN